MIGVLRGTDVLVFGALLLVAQLQELVLGYLLGRYREATAEGEMRYVLVWQSVLLAALLIGAAVLREQGSPVPGLLLVVALKTAGLAFPAIHGSVSPVAPSGRGSVRRKDGCPRIHAPPRGSNA